jgi:hypothetical protein
LFLTLTSAPAGLLNSQQTQRAAYHRAVGESGGINGEMPAQTLPLKPRLLGDGRAPRAFRPVVKAPGPQYERLFPRFRVKV